MKFPALLIYNDFTVKLIEDEGDLHGDLTWTLINYEHDDLLIDENLNVYRFVSSDSDMTFGILNDNNILHSNVGVTAVIGKLNQVKKNNNINQKEKKYVNVIFDRLRKNA